MVIDGGGFVIREKILVEEKREVQEAKEKKNGKARSLRQTASPKKSDVLEISAENMKAASVRIKDFEVALSVLERTVSLISKGGQRLEDVHSGAISGSAIKIIVS